MSVSDQGESRGEREAAASTEHASRGRKEAKGGHESREREDEGGHTGYAGCRQLLQHLNKIALESQGT